MMNSYLRTYFVLSSILLLLTGLINSLVDPLWYGTGNRLTGQNFSFNERVSKTNLLLHSQRQQYDCLILGSSRVTLIKASAFKNQHCFNYSFSAGQIEEFVAYAKYAKEKGLNPKKVYVGVDAFNFNKSTSPNSIGKIEPQPMYQAYFSLDVFFFSMRTLLGLSPNPRYYNPSFESELVKNPPTFEPKFFNNQESGICNASKVKEYEKLRAVFPNAEFVGYVPPLSAWNVVNESYSHRMIDCDLQAFYQISKIFNVMYDFSIPSSITTQEKNTYDGSHFIEEIQAQVAEVLQGKPSNFGIRINQYSFTEYQKFYKMKIKEFLDKEGEGKRWSLSRN